MTNCPSLLSPFPLLILAIFSFTGWIAYDGARPVPGAGFAALPAPELLPVPSMSVCVVEGEPPLQPGMPREAVERLVGPVAPESTETIGVVQGVSVWRVDYRVCLVGGRETPGGWSWVTVEFEADSLTQVVSHVTVMPLLGPPPPPEIDPLDE